MIENVSINEVNNAFPNTLIEQLGMRFTLVEEGMVEATMPVDTRTTQPAGILHGGATIALAETVAGFGSYVLCDKHHVSVGMQVNANHLSSPTEGEVHARGRLIHRGKKSHFWMVDVFSDDGQLVSVVSVTNMIIEKR